MDSNFQEVNTFLFLVAKDNLNKYQLDIISSISICLFESKNVDTFLNSSRDNVYSLLEYVLNLKYNSILQEMIDINH